MKRIICMILLLSMFASTACSNVAVATSGPETTSETTTVDTAETTAETTTEETSEETSGSTAEETTGNNETSADNVQNAKSR